MEEDGGERADEEFVNCILFMVELGIFVERSVHEYFDDITDGLFNLCIDKVIDFELIIKELPFLGLLLLFQLL